MKKQFVSPICSIIEVDTADVLTTSELGGIDLGDFGFFESSKTDLPGIRK